jgi:hypothetical protein
MRRFVLTAILCTAGAFAQAPQAVPTPAPAPDTETKPLPDIRKLVLDVERNEKIAEAQSREYTYHVHQVEQEMDGKGNVKKTTVTDSESLTIQGVRVDRIVARNGKPLTADEAKKESDRIDKEVEKAKERREKHEAKGQDTDSRGDTILGAERILELGTFSNPRRVDLNGRPTIVADYTGDPNAKTKNSAEGTIRDLVGTVWFDEQDRVLVQGQGHFLNDFKIGGGLVLNLHKGLSFDFRTQKINGEAWLPTSIQAHGSVRFLLFVNINGSLTVETSNYRKFHATSTITGTNGEIGPDDKPVNPPQQTAHPQQTAPPQP